MIYTQNYKNFYCLVFTPIKHVFNNFKVTKG